MYISEEWLALEKEVLGRRPLISGSVDEVRAAYQETSEMLAQLYPAIDSYQVVDRKEVTDSGIAIRVYNPSKIESGAKLPVGVLSVHPSS
ncbi:Aldehyde dehydrogenase N-terminal [Penicillium atrosanguineum]|uniref:Aldehyde dehydrogenase N-terminal n=1 Tax=Penicillium atrosanguineum TaxID=1132637 RepID=UPI00238C1C9C|nr:Aldehyde dehydrogenase N-terminal [Penicillium atrosanguineum]KAJ5296298.1 Aldehyde dehydrogenase N-terminal [Penicillium atrosanguineum]